MCDSDRPRGNDEDSLTSKAAVQAHVAHISRLLLPGDGDRILPGSARHTERKDGGGWQYTLASLMEALLAGRLLSNAANLQECMRRSVHFLLGPEIAQQMQRDLDKQNIRVPSESSLSRARLKLDALLPLVRRRFFLIICHSLVCAICHNLLFSFHFMFGIWICLGS